MKKYLIAIPTALVLSSVAFANAQISFEQKNVPSSISSPTTVKGAGIDGLGNTTPANGTFTIENDAQGRPYNTNIAVENVNSNIPQIAQGSIGWSSEGGSTYTITLSAGGNPGQWDPKQDYCILMYANGQKIGENCTDHNSYWSPTLINGIQIAQNTQLKAVIEYK